MPPRAAGANTDTTTRCWHPTTRRLGDQATLLTMRSGDAHCLKLNVTDRRSMPHPKCYRGDLCGHDVPNIGGIMTLKMEHAARTELADATGMMVGDVPGTGPAEITAVLAWLNPAAHRLR